MVRCRMVCLLFFCFIRIEYSFIHNWDGNEIHTHSTVCFSNIGIFIYYISRH